MSSAINFLPYYGHPFYWKKNRKPNTSNPFFFFFFLHPCRQTQTTVPYHWLHSSSSERLKHVKNMTFTLASFLVIELKSNRFGFYDLWVGVILVFESHWTCYYSWSGNNDLVVPTTDNTNFDQYRMWQIQPNPLIFRITHSKNLILVIGMNLVRHVL